VSDPLTGFEEEAGTLTPGSVVSFATNYTVQSADERNGQVENVAFVSGTAPNGSIIENSSSVTVQVEQCEIVIPNAFSPNDDGIQDTWRIKCIEKYPEARVEIYNRWGNRVFEKDNFGNTDIHGSADAWWDGYSSQKLTFGNEKLPTGTYYYILNLNDGSEPINGFIFMNW
jgi:gliding motility-associated-like protein